MAKRRRTLPAPPSSLTPPSQRTYRWRATTTSWVTVTYETALRLHRIHEHVVPSPLGGPLAITNVTALLKRDATADDIDALDTLNTPSGYTQ